MATMKMWKWKQMKRYSLDMKALIWRRGFGSHGYQDQVRHIMVYEAYIMLDTEGEGIAKLHRIVKAGNVILDKEQVDRRPFSSSAHYLRPTHFTEVTSQTNYAYPERKNCTHTLNS